MQDSFLHFSAHDFLECDEFLAWQRQPERLALATAWANWLAAHPEKMPEIEEAKKLLTQLQPTSIGEAAIDIDSLWSQIDTQISEEEPVSRGSIIRLWPRLAIAASVALLLGFYFLIPKSTTLRIQPQEHLALSLPDNSQVFVHADSKISFDKKGFAQDRAVKLWGEAFFTVESGNAFQVITPLGKVEVLGTEFTVFQRGDSFEVDCQEGSVRVLSDGQSPIILSAGQTAQLIESRLVRNTSENRYERQGWQYTYEKEPLSNIFMEMERHFAVTVEYPEELKDLHSGVVNMEDLQTALEDLAYSYSFTYSILGEKVTIRMQ
ncbi:MAG: FecR domain-containing protein [Saprospiraceae bacterium]|nr:FecR domain-containing protein [Saprospiraceae bacterium]